MNKLESILPLEKRYCAVHGDYETLEVTYPASHELAGKKILFCSKCAKDVNDLIDKELAINFGCIHSKTVNSTIERGQFIELVIKCADCGEILETWNNQYRLWVKKTPADLLEKKQYAYKMKQSELHVKYYNLYKKNELEL